MLDRPQLLEQLKTTFLSMRHQYEKINQISGDLKSSVHDTRELVSEKIASFNEDRETIDVAEDNKRFYYNGFDYIYACFAQTDAQKKIQSLNNFMYGFKLLDQQINTIDRFNQAACGISNNDFKTLSDTAEEHKDRGFDTIPEDELNATLLRASDVLKSMKQLLRDLNQHQDTLDRTRRLMHKIEDDSYPFFPFSMLAFANTIIQHNDGLDFAHCRIEKISKTSATVPAQLEGQTVSMALVLDKDERIRYTSKTGVTLEQYASGSLVDKTNYDELKLDDEERAKAAVKFATLLLIGRDPNDTKPILLQSGNPSYGKQASLVYAALRLLNSGRNKKGIEVNFEVTGYDAEQLKNNFTSDEITAIKKQVAKVLKDVIQINETAYLANEKQPLAEGVLSVTPRP